MWKAISSASTMCLILSFVATSAHACPHNTRFSAYKGHGICAILGQGATAFVTCNVASGACPAGTTREHSNNDPTRDYCCPTVPADRAPPICVWRGTPPFCGGECEVGETVKARSGPKTMGCATGSMAYCCH